MLTVCTTNQMKLEQKLVIKCGSTNGKLHISKIFSPLTVAVEQRRQIKFPAQVDNRFERAKYYECCVQRYLKDIWCNRQLIIL